MAVRLRLRRMGRKKRPFYRIVAADSRSPRDGRCIEEIGYYNPLSDPITLEVNEERSMYWLRQGAEPSSTVKSLLRRKGIVLKFDLLKRGVAEEKIEEEMKKWEILSMEREKRLSAIREAKKAKAAEASTGKKQTTDEKEEKSEVASEENA